MKGLIGTCLLLNLGGQQQTKITYGFATENYVIEMTGEFPRPYAGRRLVVYSSLDPGTEACYSGDGIRAGKCVEHFVGAVAIVKYSVREGNGKPPRSALIQEKVDVIAQSRDLPHRPTFCTTQQLVNGIGSDIQVFGYDEERVKKGERPRTSVLALQSWRRFRQALYINQDAKPFAVVEWMHTLRRISIVRIHSGPLLADTEGRGSCAAQGSLLP